MKKSIAGGIVIGLSVHYRRPIVKWILRPFGQAAAEEVVRAVAAHEWDHAEWVESKILNPIQKLNGIKPTEAARNNRKNHEFNLATGPFDT